MTAEEIVKIVCDYFNSIEDKIQEDYEREINDPNWSSTDAYCYTPERSPRYATVDVDRSCTTIKYHEYEVHICDMPNVLIQSIGVSFEEEVVRYGFREEIGNKHARIKTVYYGFVKAEFDKLTADDIVPLILRAEKEKRVVDFQIIDENWYKSHH